MDGASQREHLLTVERQTGIKPKELENLKEMPDSMLGVWYRFRRLSNRRQSGMGVNPISFQEMKAFYDLLGLEPDPEEIELIELFDNQTVKFFNKKQAQASKKPVKKAGR